MSSPGTGPRRPPSTAFESADARSSSCWRGDRSSRLMASRAVKRSIVSGLRHTSRRIVRCHRIDVPGRTSTPPEPPGAARRRDDALGKLLLEPRRRRLPPRLLVRGRRRRHRECFFSIAPSFPRPSRRARGSAGRGRLAGWSLAGAAGAAGAAVAESRSRARVEVRRRAVVAPRGRVIASSEDALVRDDRLTNASASERS